MNLLEELLAEIRIDILFVLFLPVRRHQDLLSFFIYCLIILEVEVRALVVYIKLLLVSNGSKIDQFKFLVIVIGICLHILLDIRCPLNTFDDFVCCFEVEGLIAAELDDLVFVSVVHDQKDALVT